MFAVQAVCTLRTSVSVNFLVASAGRRLGWATQLISQPCAAPAATPVTWTSALEVPLRAVTRCLSTSSSQSFAASSAGSPTSQTTNAFDDKMRGKTEQELLQIIEDARSHAVKPGDAGAEEEEEVEEDPVNPETGERYGPKGKEPTRFGDWESKGRCTDFS